MPDVLWREGSGGWRSPIALPAVLLAVLPSPLLSPGEDTGLGVGGGVEGSKATGVSGKGGKGRWVTIRGRRVFVRKGRAGVIGLEGSKATRLGKGQWRILPDGRRVRVTAPRARGLSTVLPGDRVEDSKARGRGGKFGRWRTLKGGRPVFITGGTPTGGLSVRTGPGMFDKTLFDTFGDVDSERVDRLIHDFEKMPAWAVDDIAVIEVYERSGARFTAGGENFQTGMDYDHAMARIRVFQANSELSRSFANTGLYHEVGHSIESRYTKAVLSQSAAARDEHPDWFRPGPAGYGRLRSDRQAGYKKAYPLASSWDTWQKAWSGGQDGITAYSEAWAKELGGWGETFAEMSQIYFGSGAQRLLSHGKKVGAPDLARSFVDTMDAFSKGQDRKDLDDKARGRGGKLGRWRTLKDGKRVFVSGGVPSGGATITRRGMRDTEVKVVGDVDPTKVDSLLHGYEELPGWATRDISSIEIHEGTGRSFTIGGESFETQMDYTHSKSYGGRVRVFSANTMLGKEWVPQNFYHEVGHGLAKRWSDAGNDQSIDALRHHPDWFRANGTLIPGREKDYAKSYPMGASWDAFHAAWSRGQDGISSYSSAWAKAGNYQETIAEMTRVYFADGARKVTQRAWEVSAKDLGKAFNDAMTAFSKGQDR